MNTSPQDPALPRWEDWIGAALVCAALLLSCAASAAAELPGSVAALFDRLPDMPETPVEAARWFDRRETLIHPGLLALKSDLRAHQQAVARLRETVAAKSNEQAEVVAQNLSQGLADIGVDMARMQRDPAYAQQVQERMRSMSPQQIIAMSQRMTQPLNQDGRFINEASAKAAEAAPIRAAAEAGQAYQQELGARLEALSRIAREADAETAKLRAKPLALPAGRPKIEWENIGCDAGCRAQWDSYANALAPLMIARAGEELRVHRSALRRAREHLAEGVRTADRHLQASRWGQAARSNDNRQLILGYDDSATGNLPHLIERLETATKDAAAMVHCAKHWVLAPRAVCNWQ